MTERRQVSWKRVGQMLMTIFLVVILSGGFALAVAYQLGPWRAAGSMHALDPDLDRIPSALHDTSFVTLQGERLEQFGVSFQLPWKHADVRLQNNMLISSGEGATIIFQDPSSDVGTTRMIHELGKSIHGLNSEDKGSVCGLQRVAMYARSTDVKWWRTPSQNKRAQFLLILKVLTEPPTSDGIRYAVNINGLCGFQRGNPLVSPYQVWVELFDSADRHYKITISSRRHSTMFKQADINALIASIRPGSPR